MGFSLEKSPFLQTLSGNGPQRIRSSVTELLKVLEQSSKNGPRYLNQLEEIVRFASGGSVTDETSPWTDNQQTYFTKLLQNNLLNTALSHHGTTSANGTKRVLPAEEDTPSQQSSKKPRLDSQETWYQHQDLFEDETDIHQYTICNISATSPIRKKVDISIHKRTIRITPAAAGKDKDGDKAKSQTLVFLLKDLKRSFILPTHGKQKPHYTMIMTSSDVTSVPKGSTTTTDSGETHWQICLGSELTPPNLVTRSKDSPACHHPKGASISPVYDAFQGFAPPNVNAFKPWTSDHTNASGGTGVDGYRAAKPGTLWFLREGILWDAKPIEFWAIEDLVPANGGKGGQVIGGVRMLSATGRSCTVILRRRVPRVKKAGDDEDDDGEDVVETDFEMIEGKEQDGISEWCRKYSKNFGGSSLTATSTAKTSTSAPAPSASGKGKGKARATDDDMEIDGEGGTAKPSDLSNNPLAEDEGDLDDDNFTDSDSELSDGSDSEDGEDSGDSAGDSGGDSDSDADEEEEGEGEMEGEESRPEPESEEIEDGDEEPLDPKHHPLLRPGAMPKKISKAALNAVVGMMEEDFSMKVAAAAAGSDEEDELDDDEL